MAKRITMDEVTMNMGMYDLGKRRIGHNMDPEWGPDVPTDPTPWNPPLYVEGIDRIKAWNVYVEIAIGAM